jgi:hypothetical protein
MCLTKKKGYGRSLSISCWPLQGYFMIDCYGCDDGWHRNTYTHTHTHTHTHTRMPAIFYLHHCSFPSVPLLSEWPLHMHSHVQGSSILVLCTTHTCYVPVTGYRIVSKMTKSYFMELPVLLTQTCFLSHIHTQAPLPPLPPSNSLFSPFLSSTLLISCKEPCGQRKPSRSNHPSNTSVTFLSDSKPRPKMWSVELE